MGRKRKDKLLYETLPAAYNAHKNEPVDERKVIFIELRLPDVSNSFRILYDELQRDFDLDIHVHLLRNSFVPREEYIRRCKEMLADAATAKYIFVNEASDVLSCVDMRPETIVTQLWHACGAFKKFGMSTAELIFGPNAEELKRHPNNKNYTYVTVSSPEIVWAYAEAMDMKDRQDAIRPVGTSRTDIFYRSETIAQAFQNLYKEFPKAKGKKIILYAPTFRGRVARAKTPDCFDLEKFAEHFKDEYVVIFKHHPLVKNVPQIPEELNGTFAIDATKTMTIEDLLCVSDICISDYSSLVFEYSLFERPMLFFAYDLDEYFDWRGFYYDYNELTPGPVCKTNDEMIDYISHLDERFDKQKVIDFKEKFMRSCDGHATDRILHMVFADRYDSLKLSHERTDDEIKVSVVMPVYNAENYLFDSLGNVLKQTLKDIEVICVDDGSTDRSAEIIEDYASRDFRLSLIRQKNQYAGAARNAGFAKSRGKYVVFWDADDRFALDALEKLYTKADVNARKEAGKAGEAAGSTSADPVSEAITAGLGGKKNISDVDCCATRLRCTVHDAARVSDGILKATGASGVVHKGNGVQVIYGPNVTVIKSNLEDYLEKAPNTYAEAENTPTPKEAEPTQETKEQKVVDTITVCSPISGLAADLSTAPDEAFAEKMMGDGAVVTPEDPYVRAPEDGEVAFVFDTKHAIGFVTDSGVSLLIHVGIDTVKLNGEGFEALVESGQTVKKGDPMLKLDLEYLKTHAPSVTSPVLCTELEEIQRIRLLADGPVKAGDPLFAIEILA